MPIQSLWCLMLLIGFKKFEYRSKQLNSKGKVFFLRESCSAGLIRCALTFDDGILNTSSHMQLKFGENEKRRWAHRVKNIFFLSPPIQYTPSSVQGPSKCTAPSLCLLTSALKTARILTVNGMRKDTDLECTVKVREWRKELKYSVLNGALNGTNMSKEDENWLLSQGVS